MQVKQLQLRTVMFQPILFRGYFCTRKLESNPLGFRQNAVIQVILQKGALEFSYGTGFPFKHR